MSLVLPIVNGLKGTEKNTKVDNILLSIKVCAFYTYGVTLFPYNVLVINLSVRRVLIHTDNKHQMSAIIVTDIILMFSLYQYNTEFFTLVIVYNTERRVSTISF